MALSTYKTSYNKKRTGSLWQVDRAKQSNDDENYEQSKIDLDINSSTKLVKKIRFTFNINDTKDINNSANNFNRWTNINFTGKQTYSGKWISPVYDVNSDDGISFLSYIASFPVGTNISLKVNSSDDGQYWYGWVSLSGSGDTIPNKRFIRVEVTLSVELTSSLPTLTSFTISCINKESKYDLTKLCDVNNEIHGVNYIGKYYFVDGNNYYVYDGIDVFKVVEPPSGFTPDPQPATSGKWYMRTTKSLTAYSGVNLNMFNGGVIYDAEESKMWYEP